MARYFSHKRKFGGRVYYHIDHYAKKFDAETRAKSLRRYGYLARVTKASHLGYDVWRTSK